MSRVVPSLVKLERRADRMRRFAESAWAEGPDGSFRVNLASPQFSLRGFRSELTALAEREGYTVTEETVGKGWSTGFLVIVPKKAEGDSDANSDQS